MLWDTAKEQNIQPKKIEHVYVVRFGNDISTTRMLWVRITKL
jgi:hypothetical protein